MIGNFLILVIIGAAVGYVMLHYGSTWLRQQFATTSGEITYGLVGIAGSFMGYEIGLILSAGTRTICKHVERILTKLCGENRTAAAAIAIAALAGAKK